jgi:hypothetical protein
MHHGRAVLRAGAVPQAGIDAKLLTKNLILVPFGYPCKASADDVALKVKRRYRGVRKELSGKKKNTKKNYKGA